MCSMETFKTMEHDIHFEKKEISQDRIDTPIRLCHRTETIWVETPVAAGMFGWGHVVRWNPSKILLTIKTRSSKRHISWYSEIIDES